MSITIMPDVDIPDDEVEFVFSRSGGPGGQNVNKVETRVVLLFDISRSSVLSDKQKKTLHDRLPKRSIAGTVVRVSSSESRSQWKNRQDVVGKFTELLRKALTPRRVRKRTRPTSSSREKRLTQKKKTGEKKVTRGRFRGE